jgi:hypothetical protein
MIACRGAPAVVAPIAAAFLLLSGCGSSGNSAATSTPPAPTATIVRIDTTPAGSTPTTGARRAPAMATGEHDRAGDLCSGRDPARYVRERLTCVTGRLRPTK